MYKKNPKIEIIHSLQNPRIKSIVKWRNRPARDSDQVVLIEGYRALLRALSANYPVNELYICPQLFQGSNENDLIAAYEAQGTKVFHLSAAAFHKIAYRDKPEGLLGIGKQLRKTLSDLPKLPNDAFFLVCEQIEKPGNLGTIMRSADAVKVDALLLCDSRTDLYNPNTVRASTGNLFTLPLAEADSETCIKWLKNNNVKICAASPHAKKLYTEVDMTCSTAIVVGSEQYGLSSKWLEAADEKLRLPMYGEADSLNVATAAAIMLYETIRQRILSKQRIDPGAISE